MLMRPDTPVRVAAALLWTAPELLRIPRNVRPSEGTYSADVFSYAIVVYELCFLKRPYGDQLTELGAPGNTAVLDKWNMYNGRAAVHTRHTNS